MWPKGLDVCLAEGLGDAASTSSLGPTARQFDEGNGNATVACHSRMPRSGFS